MTLHDYRTVTAASNGSHRAASPDEDVERAIECLAALARGVTKPPLPTSGPLVEPLRHLVDALTEQQRGELSRTALHAGE